jgi:hypothetical protein
MIIQVDIEAAAGAGGGGNSSTGLAHSISRAGWHEHDCTPAAFTAARQHQAKAKTAEL